MPARNDSRGASWGFSLLEVAIAIAVMAILAGTAIPLVLKSVNQAKEQRARQELKQIYESMFGATDRQVPNLRSDMGYAGGVNLAQLTRILAARAYAPYVAQPSLSGGWRGPYWNGNSTAAGVPRDPWNNPYQARLVGGAWQVFSTGSSPTNAADDVVYPTSNPLPGAPGCSLTVNLRRRDASVPVGVLTATAVYPSAGANPTNFALAETPPASGVFISTAGAVLPSGPVALVASIPTNVPTGQVAQTITQIVQAPAGGTLVVNLTFQ